ncbi:hypothetical protein [Pseudonocardia xishanensis]|uniref:DUF3558 domain-containing protein n=1 Tax=Pseudonocardia xishanensis TaxID=630995 RepID=A0ABP8S037_9PSEU
MSQQPQGQGWWQATDGLWYPPQQWRPPPPGPGPQAPPQYSGPQPGGPQPSGPQYGGPQYGGPQYGQTARPPRKPRRGCLVAVVVAVVLVLVVAGIAAYFVNRAVTAVQDVSGGAGSFGQASCPGEQAVSAAVGSPVTLAMSGNVIVASGCSYLAVDRAAGADVQITVGFALAADDQFAQVASDAATQGTTPEPISVGDRGEAFGAPGRSDAIAVTGDSMILVEVFNAGSKDIGDRKDAAVALLEQVIAAR